MSCHCRYCVRRGLQDVVEVPGTHGWYNRPAIPLETPIRQPPKGTSRSLEAHVCAFLDDYRKIHGWARLTRQAKAAENTVRRALAGQQVSQETADRMQALYDALVELRDVGMDGKFAS